MKKDIFSTLGIDLNRKEDLIINRFHYYSHLLENAILGIPFQGRPNSILYVDLNGDVFSQDEKIDGIDHIMALIAIGKQKKTMSQTLQHERRLGMFGVVQKSHESIAIFHRKMKNIGAASSRLNHLIPLHHAYDLIKKIQGYSKSEKIILLGIVFTYARLNGVPPDLFFIEDEGQSVEWDDLIYKNFKGFDPIKFWSHYESRGYVRIPRDLFENFIPFVEQVTGEINRSPIFDDQVGVYVDEGTPSAIDATAKMLKTVSTIMQK